MRLEDYLKAIKECPDDVVEFVRDTKTTEMMPLLTLEWGIYNNFAIHLSADFDGVVKRFKKSNRYILMYDIDGGLDTTFYTLSRLDIVNVNIIPYFNESSCDFRNYAMTMGVFMHDYGRTGDVVELRNQARAMARVIDDIGQFIIKENIPACLPQSIGWKYRDSRDKVSRIAVNMPLLPIVSDYLRISA